MSERTAAERVALARHPQRPNITDYISGLFTDFFEQKGDRLCREDPAILGGIARYHGRPVTVIGTRKGKTAEESLRCNFGMERRYFISSSSSIIVPPSSIEGRRHRNPHVRRWLRRDSPDTRPTTRIWRIS